MYVLHLSWIHDGIAGQETYGPFIADDDLGYLEQAGLFMRDWQVRTGYQATAGVIALVVDPLEWLAAHPAPPGG